MMPKVTVALDQASLKKGDILTKDVDGRYYNKDKTYWSDAAPIEEKESIFLVGVVPAEQIPDEVILYYVSGDGTVHEQRTGDTKPPMELAKNAFLEKAKAQAVGELFIGILNAEK